MLTQTIKYKDFNDVEREGTIYFNITRAELVRWLIMDEGLINRLQTIQTRSGKEIIEEFDGFIKKAFGVRSDDGKRFVKSDEIYEDFITTALYDEFFTRLVNDPEEATKFVNGLLPQELIQSAQKDLKMQQDAGLVPEKSQDTQIGNTAPPTGASGI